MLFIKDSSLVSIKNFLLTAIDLTNMTCLTYVTLDLKPRQAKHKFQQNLNNPLKNHINLGRTP